MNALIAQFVAQARQKLTRADLRALTSADAFGDWRIELIDADRGGRRRGRTVDFSAEVARWRYDNPTMCVGPTCLS